MNILFGGSFNPPTLAHYEIVKLLDELYTPKRIVLMLVGNNYNKPELIDGKIRLEMTRIMASHFENVVVSDFEVTRPFRGTIRSLEYLVETYKEDVALAIGADNFIYLSTWIEAEALIKNYKIIVFDRDGLITEEVVMLFEEEYGVKIDVISFSFNISASEIRSNPKKYRKNLLPEVYEYIQNNKLYLKEDKKWKKF